MFLSDLSIKRPIFAAVLMLALVTLGAFSYRRLAVDLWPDVEVPVLIVTTQYPGASPDSVEREVSKKIEEAVNPIAGVKHVFSSSREGVSVVGVEFALEVRINEATQEARAKINAARGSLPPGIEDPVIQKVDFSAMPVVSLAVRSSTLSPRDLSTLVEKRVKRRLENLSGVGKVELVGLAEREVTVDLDPLRLEALGLGVDEVIAGLRSENADTPVGRLADGRGETPVRVAGKPGRARDFAGLEITKRGSRPVALGEVATVADGAAESRTLAFVDGSPAIGIDVQKQSGANTVEVVRGVKAAVAKLGAELPPGTTVELVRDASVFIDESVADVQNSLVLGGLLTIAIVFCFLNSWRSTVITGLTLPISVIASFVAMHFLGMTLNTMTLLALSLAIGLLIDDAIVVRENIVRHLEEGKDHFTAAREGTAQIGLAVLATTLSIVAVFVPVAFMKGVVGRFFYSFGITVTFAVLVSLFVSFTLDPMLSSRWVDPDLERGGRRGFVRRLLEGFNARFEAAADRYRGAVLWALTHRKTVIALAAASFGAGLAIFVTLPSSFMPGYDKGELQVNFETAPGASIEETRDRMAAVLATIRALPEVERCYGTIGANDTTVRDGSVYVKLKPRAMRRRSQAEVQRELRERLAAVPGIASSLLEAGGFRAEKTLQLSIRGEDLALLKAYSRQLKAAVADVPGLVDVSATLEHEVPELRLAVDRQRALDAGLTTGDVVRALQAFVGGQAVTTFEDEQGDSVDVRVRLPAALRRNPGQLDVLRLPLRRPGPAGAPVFASLGDLLVKDLAATPSEIRRKDLSREVVVAANVDGIAVGDAVERVRAATARIPLAPGYRIVIGGEAEDMAESFGYMAEALLLAVVLVYLILAAQFESFVDPLSIMLSLPLSLVGLAGALRLTGDTISIMSLIGLIMLMGLVTKNAILLIDYAKVLRAQGLDRTEALVEAGRTRLRPILMTTGAMVFGMLPLALALGEGAEMRAPMARAVIGGLLTSTLLTLLVVPVVYSVLDDLSGCLRRRWVGVEEPEPATAAGAEAVPAAAAAAALALLLASLPPAAQAEDFRVLTLPEALKIAAERNLAVESAREARNELQGRYVEERAAALPQLTLTASAGRQRDASQAALSGGGSPAVSYQTARASVAQPLFTWGQVGAAIRAAMLGLGTADDRLRLTRQQATLDVTSAYYDVLLARELHALARATLDQRLRHRDEAEKRLSAGVATDYDVLSARVAAENARPEVIRAENQIRLARDRLRFLLALEEPDIDVAGTLEPAAGTVPSYDSALKTALERRPDLAELRKRIGVSRELVKVAQAGDKPRLDLQAGFGWARLEAGGPGADGPEWSAGFVATWPLFDGLRSRGRVAQARSSEASLRIEERRLVDAVALEVRDASNALREAEEVLRAMAGTVSQAERLLGMAEQGYALGIKTKLDVDDAQTNLTEARGSLARARRDHLVARTALDRATGTLGVEG